MSDLVSALNDAAGAEIAVAGAAAREGFAVDGVHPGAVAHPETPEQVAAVLKAATEQTWALVPWGGGNGIGRGNAPERYDVALSLARLAQIHDHDVPNLTLIADAGVTVAQANREVGENHHLLAVAYRDTSRTLGGIIASNALVPKRLLYGEVRDQLLGLAVALPDGSVVRYGRKVLKNVAGYDMNKLFLGSQGMLGVVVEATFKLFALPDQERHLLAALPSLDAAATAAAALFRSPLLPSQLRILDPAAAALAHGALQQPAPEGAAHLLVSFEGRTQALQRQTRDSRALLADHGATAVGEVDRLAPALREVLESHAAGPTEPATVRLRLGTVPTGMAALLERTATALRDLEAPHAIITDYGAGQAVVALGTLSDAGLVSVAGLVGAVRSELARSQGYVVVEAGPPALKEQLNALGETAGEAALMRQLKRRFDPQDVLVPGRYLTLAGGAAAR